MRPPALSHAGRASTAHPSVGNTRAMAGAENRSRRSLRMRARVTLFFTLTALAASLGLAVVTYAVARNYLLDQRVSTAQSQAYNNAKAVRDELRAPTGNVRELLLQLRTEGSGFAILLLPPDQPYYSNIRFQEEVLPAALVANVDRGINGYQRFDANGDPYLGVGIRIAEFDGTYFEAFPLEATERSVQSIATALGIGAAVTALLAASVGWWTNRRLLQPLSRVAKAAEDIAAGGLDTRMPPETDPDLARLATSFNDMADAVQTRIEREARFASDVSHELRTPITALSAAVEVLDARRADLPERTQQALDVVVTQVRRFDQMVIDLLELSRIDAGSTELHRESVHVADLVGRIAQRYGFADVPIEVAPDLPAVAQLDKLRFERVLANLLDNANQHGGGPVRITLSRSGRQALALAVDDAGPGVARGERSRIFERFARGSAARHKIGTGLGLALVAEHAQAHGGEAWVEDRPGGGARFVATFDEAG